MIDERRTFSRQRVLKPATISFSGGAISCALRNVSRTGASLEVDSPIGIPEAFDLVMDNSRRPCRVIWRREKRIGVRFQDRNE